MNLPVDTNVKCMETDKCFSGEITVPGTGPAASDGLYSFFPKKENGPCAKM